MVVPHAVPVQTALSYNADLQTMCAVASAHVTQDGWRQGDTAALLASRAITESAAVADQSIPVKLQQAKMRLWSLSDCVSSYYYATPLMLCAGYKSGYIANCRVIFAFNVFTHCSVTKKTLIKLLNTCLWIVFQLWSDVEWPLQSLNVIYIDSWKWSFEYIYSVVLGLT